MQFLHSTVFMFLLSAVLCGSGACTVYNGAGMFYEHVFTRKNSPDKKKKAAVNTIIVGLILLLTGIWNFTR